MKEVEGIKMESVLSSNIRQIGYDRVEKTLQVNFKNNRNYQYCPVSLETYKELRVAESFGKYLNAKILSNCEIKYIQIK